MRHFYESYHQRRLRSRIGNYNHHNHNHHNHDRTHLYPSYLHHHHHLPQPRTTLCCLVQNRTWPEVVRRSRTHPHEVMFQDAVTGNTPLHVAMRMDPPCDVIQALKSTSRMQNWDGATPLHVAASHRCSARALTTLLEVSSSAAAAVAAKPAALARTEKCSMKSGKGKEEEDDEENESVLSALSRTGRAPIHYACSSFRGLELEAFKVLFEATLKNGNLRLQTKDQQQQKSNNHDEKLAMSGDEDVDFWLGEEDEDENNDDMVQDFRKEEEIIRMIMGNEDYHDHDDDVTEQEKQQQQRGDTTTHQVVVVNVLGLKDATGQTPLGLLFRRYRERVRLVINRIDRIHDAATAAVQRDALRRGNNNSRARTTNNVPGRERLRRASLVASLTVQGELGELWSKARWIVARLTQERLEREQDWKYYPGPKTTQETAATSPQAVAVAKEAADWAAEQCQSSFSHNNPLRDEHSDFFVPVPTINTMHKKIPQQESEAGATSTCPSRKFRIVHASVGLTGYGCPPEMIRLAISVHPHQVYEMDEDGNLPIHIAAMASSHLASAEDANNNNNNHNSFSDYLTAASFADSSAASVGDDHSVLSDAMNSFFSSATISQTTNPFDKVIKILLQHYPQAAQIPQGKFPGKLPLVLAMEQHEQHEQQSGMVMIRGGGGGGNRRASWEDGIRTLMNAHPPALHSSNRKHDITRALYANVLALVAEDYVMTSRLPSFRLMSSPGTLTLPLSSSSRQQQQQQRLPQRSSSTSKLLRREACARTTVFELLRTKPEWLGATED